MSKSIGKTIVHIFLLIIGLILLISLVLFSVYLNIPKPPNAWGWLEEYSSDQETYTMHEAYGLIQPLIIEWHRDSYITEAGAGYLWADDPTYHIQPDGRNLY